MDETRLCIRCQALRIPRLFDGPRYKCEEDMIYSEDFDVRIASIAELRKEPDCTLCYLLAKIYKYEQTDHNAEDGETANHFASRQDPRKVHCVLRPIRADLIMFYDLGILVDQVATHLLVEFDPAVPVMFHTWDQGRADAAQGAVTNPQIGYKNKSIYRGWTIAPDLVSAAPNRPMMNRFSTLSETVDIKRVKSLLDVCERHHTACKRAVSAADQALDATQIVLLDVTERRIIRADTRTPYVALSYVWDLIDREGYQGFKDGSKEGCVVPNLPCIMEDAITVVKGLGEKYLWIDLLCIDQNNPAKKKMQISQMNIIYSHAVFTIVALARSNVHRGLPGVRPGSRSTNHYSIEIDKRTFVVGTVWYHFYTIAGSTWNSRAWTLEEGMLSTRCLFFGPHEVLFDCCSGVGSETLGLPVCNLGDQTYASIKHLPTFLEYRFWNKTFPKHWDFGFYADNVRFYCERDLSHARDSLNAFKGVLSGLSQSTGMLFIRGPPRDDLLKALLWFPAYASLRLPGFPSWTWAAWTGPRGYSSIYQPLIEQMQAGEGSDAAPRLCGAVAKITIPSSGSNDKWIQITSQVRQFSLVTAEPSKQSSPLYRLVNSKGRPMIDLLGSRGNHDSPYVDDLIFLDDEMTHTPNAVDFVYLLHWKGSLSKQKHAYAEDRRRHRDHVLAMLIKKLADDSFERVALCGIPIDEWNAAPVVDGLECITLV